MKYTWFFLRALFTVLIVLLNINTPASAQNPEEQMSNQMEPLNRRTRQWWVPTGWLGGWNLPKPPSSGPRSFPEFSLGGSGGDVEIACGILCPDNVGDFIPYRSPRPTKGNFIPIRG